MINNFNHTDSNNKHIFHIITYDDMHIKIKSSSQKGKEN